MSDNMMDRAKSIIEMADAAKNAGRDFSSEEEEVWDVALTHIQDGRGQLALVAANKLSAMAGLQDA